MENEVDIPSYDGSFASDDFDNPSGMPTQDTGLEQNLDQDDQVKITKEFKENVYKYVHYDDLAKKMEKEAREIKAQRKKHEEFILSYLEEVGESMIEITGGKLRRNKSETKVPLSHEMIKDAAIEKFKDKKKVDEFMEFMDTMRPKSTRINLKRTNERGPRKKKT